MAILFTFNSIFIQKGCIPICLLIKKTIMEIFENICRTCGNDCLEALNIYEDSAMVLDKKLPISDIISACLPANAALTALNKDDDYPKQICRICVKKLAIIYEFNNKWLTANNEFNVALKFEQRRKRGRQSQTSVSAMDPLPLASYTVVDENDQPLAKADNIVFKFEPNESVELEDVKSGGYMCSFCDERYHTLAACQKHHKVKHRHLPFTWPSPS